MANQDTDNINISSLGTLNISFIANDQATEDIDFSASGSLSFGSIYMPIVLEPVSFISSGSLSSPSISLIKNISIHFSSSGTLVLGTTKENVICYDIKVDFVPEQLEIQGCVMSSQTITRYRGDTYPLTAGISKNGNTNITGYTIIMSTKIDGKNIYSHTGSIVDPINGIVEFPFSEESVAVSGSGKYDIQVNDGTYKYTYISSDFILLDDLTL